MRKQKVVIRAAAFASLSLAFLSAGCGGSSSSGSQRGFVTDVRVDPAVVRQGEEIGIQVDFEPSQTGDFEGDANLDPTTVVLRLPAGVSYVQDSSEFDGSDVGGFRDRGPNRVELCADGTVVLTYQFSAGEQTDNENKIRLAAVASGIQGEVIFSAEADDRIDTPCGIFGQDSDILTVLG